MIGSSLTSSDVAPPAIELRDLTKQYWKLEERAMLLRSVLPFARTKRSPMYALRDVNLAVQQGETVGIIGRNGAGKTTLLRLMAGVTQPTRGTVRFLGRVAPLISVGVGFHQEMSGRENVFVNGMLLGMTATEVERRFDEIVAFADLEDFIDTPVKFYSSGMFMRLGFSVAVHSDPNVLLVDEVLAVGDLSFQAKCLDRMRALQAEGTSIVLVSHIMSAVRLLCPRVCVLEHGELVYDGEPEAAIGVYYQVTSAADEAAGMGSPVVVVSRELRGVENNYVELDAEVELVTRVRFQQETVDPHFQFQILTTEGLLVSTTQSDLRRPWRVFAGGEEVDVGVRFRTRLAGGSYRLVTIVTGANVDDQLLRDEGPVIYVEPRVGTWGIVDPFATIEIDGEDRTWNESVMLRGPQSQEPGSRH
ncbi:MAG: ATP-binding cassette domain-containing protein [Acidimicrobiia bacterium]|nr:ATP-binding cassette domain-containing protein [Acidimicrobiia bacterium]